MSIVVAGRAIRGAEIVIIADARVSDDPASSIVVGGRTSHDEESSIVGMA